MNQNFHIREFTPSDYQAVTEIYNLYRPNLPHTSDDFIRKDENRDSIIRHKRLCVEIGDTIAGYAEHTQFTIRYHPQKFYIEGGMLEEFTRQGIGTLLYNRLMDELSQYIPISIRAVCPGLPGTIRFFEKRGYTEFLRIRESELDPTSVDFSSFIEKIRSLKKNGIEIKSLLHLESDPNRNKKLHDLYWTVKQDIPGSEDSVRRDLETFVKEDIEPYHRPPEGYFIAVKGDEYIGLCPVSVVRADNSLSHGVTGVKHEYRRKGVAMALKLAMVRYAIDNGHTFIRTENEVNNKPIIELNQKLGYKNVPERIHFEKEIGGA